ncbi:SH3 domain-containing protein [Streptomyces lasalocidi]|uniref:SH3 domain-containing protein n=1 Tax=Streptomyces lasalocidi TaxID=324833 RepID=A0A4U5WN81_STRLS|nr:SH3 domain-containing protein [Streptomyces lasalocidi]TKT02076.1 SH3 domain-containing protein [Streptomyces lasalocidi]
MSVERIEETVGAGDTGVVAEAGTTTGAGVVAEVEIVTATAAVVTYYPVAPGVRLNVRSGPGTGYSIVRVLPEGSKVAIYCQTPGTTVSGPYGTSNIWDNIASGEFVSDAFVKTGSDGYVASRCAL